MRIATKVGAGALWACSFPAQREGLSRRAVRDGFTASLNRLGVDSVDLLDPHGGSHDTS